MVKVAESFGDWQVAVRFDDVSELRFFDTPDRELVSPGKRLIRLPNPQLEPPVAGVWKTYRYVDGLASNSPLALGNSATIVQGDLPTQL